MNQPIWVRSLSLIALLVIWQVAALLAADPGLLPGPLATLAAARDELLTGALALNVGVTLLRVAAAFIIAMVVGTAIGLALGRMARLDAVFDLWLVIALNVPALVTIVLCYIWFGLGEAAAILAVAVNKVPTVITLVREGARTLDPALSDMALVFAVPRLKRLTHIILPQLASSLMAAARAGLALTWKIVLVVELLGRPNGVGFAIRRLFNYFDIAGILAYTLVFIVIILGLETLVLKPIDRRLARWRG